MSNTRTADGPRVWRVLTAPIGPSAWRTPASRRTPARVIAATGLPAPLADLTSRVVRRTRLWHGERVEVARELCSHFAEGLAAGRAAEELVRDFGDPAAAAKLIRRAKKRARPLVWHAWVRLWQAAGVVALVCVATYGVMAARYYGGTPRVTKDYAAGLVPGSAEADRAWPLYEQAKKVLPDLRESIPLARKWGEIFPGDPEWAEANAFLDRAAPALQLARRGAERPALGASLFVPFPRSDGLPGTLPGPAAPLVNAVTTVSIGAVRDLGHVLRQDAIRAAAEGRGGAVVANLVAMVRMAEQVREVPLTFHESVSLWLLSRSCETVLEIAERDAAVLSDAHLVELAHSLGTFAGGGALRMSARGERALFDDLLQRMYTDNGHGDGRMVYVGMRLLQELAGTEPGLKEIEQVAGPVLGEVVPGRAELSRMYDAVLARVTEQTDRPLYARTEDPDELTNEVLTAGRPGGPAFSTYGVLGIVLPRFGRLSEACERITQRRDATLVAIALELHRRRHGAYPSALSELVPSLLPAVPIDRFDGGPLKYTLIDGRPVLYSVGRDRVDNGGRPTEAPAGNTAASRWASPETLRALSAARTTQHRAGMGGDWVIYPIIRYDESGQIIPRAPR